MHCSGNPSCPEITSSSIHTTLLGLDWDSDDKSWSSFEEVLEEARWMGDDILAVNGQVIKCWVQQNVGSCVMWSPRVYPFIHCKGSTEGLGGSWLSPPLIVTQRILVWYPAWQVPLGLHRILNLSMLNKGQEVIISFLYVWTYPTSASTSTTWLGAKCGCTYPPVRGHLSVNIHSPPSNRSRNYWSCFEKEAGGSDQKLSFDLSYLCESTRRRRRQDMSWGFRLMLICLLQSSVIGWRAM